MIITNRIFSTSSFFITSWWSLHTATFPLLPLLKLHDDHYKPQLFPFLLCYNFMMIITYRNFSLSSFVITSWWSLHTATVALLPLIKLHGDHYIPQLFPFLLCYNLIMIITYRNFSTSSFVITSWWSLHTATFPLLPFLSVHDDHYIPQLFHFLLCYNFMMIITYLNFFTSSFVITLWWSLHTATFPLLPLLKLHDDHYIPQHFPLLLCYNFMMIITYRNISPCSFVITSWWSLHTATFPFPPLL